MVKRTYAGDVYKTGDITQVKESISVRFWMFFCLGHFVFGVGPDAFAAALTGRIISVFGGKDIRRQVGTGKDAEEER